MFFHNLSLRATPSLTHFFPEGKQATTHYFPMGTHKSQRGVLASTIHQLVMWVTIIYHNHSSCRHPLRFLVSAFFNQDPWTSNTTGPDSVPASSNWNLAGWMQRNKCFPLDFSHCLPVSSEFYDDDQSQLTFLQLRKAQKSLPPRSDFRQFCGHYQNDAEVSY